MILEHIGLSQINGSLVVLDGVKGVQYDEMAELHLDDGSTRVGRVVEVEGDRCIIQVFEGTRGLSLVNNRTVLTGHPMMMDLSPELPGRVLDGLGRPIDGLGDIYPTARRDVNGAPINPVSRVYPRNYIHTGISSIDCLATLIRGQKLPIFSGSGMKHNELAVQIVRQASVADGSDFAIVFAAVLDIIGKKHTWLSGEGELVRKASFKVEEDEKAGQITHRETAVGLVLSTTCFLLAYVVAKKILPSIGGVAIHYFAWMVLIVAALNASGLCSPEIKAGAKRLSDFFSKQLLWVLMVGVGVCYTDLQEIINAITFANVVIAAIIVIGAVLGAAIGGWLMGFFPIESAITAGLCMANRGGSGDLEVLSACNRMNLISYAQISSRLGGGIVLVIASIVFGMMI